LNTRPVGNNCCEIDSIKLTKSNSNRDVISFFSGAMGLDIGLANSGLKIKIGQDQDRSCIQTIKSNGHEVIEGDICNIAPKDVLDVANLKPGEPFLICGGPPCQPFSTAGKRLGINDPRGSLFMDFIRMIDYIRPRFFVMENVKGIISAPLRNDYSNNKGNESNGTVLDVILSEFDKLNYSTKYDILDAVDYGVPQFRERFVLIGSRDKENLFLPFPTHFQTHQDERYRWRTLRDAIGDLNASYGDCAKFSDERMDLLKLVPEGGNWNNLPEELISKAMGGAYKSGGGKVGFYRRLSFNQPSPTLVTSPIQKSSMLCHPTENRPLSVNEYAKIQQFPHDWTFTGTITSKYRQIGNAVPIGLGEALGKTLISIANNDAMVHTKRTRSSKYIMKGGQVWQ